MIVDTMCEAIQPLLNKILNHPFNIELATGELPNEKFIFYIQQDALYLAEFSRALAITAGRLSSNAHTQQLIQFSIDAIKAENELHAAFIQQYQTIIPQLAITQSPACFTYTHFLLKTVSLNSIEEAIASLLPCFLIYHKVGKAILFHQNSENQYQNWINLYSSDTFECSVNAMVTITNELGDVASTKIKEKMVEAFIQSTRLEWLFWQSAYEQERWLI